MATFTGTAANETITPVAVSPTVTRDPAGSFPGPDNDTINGSGGSDVLDGGGGNDTIAGDPDDDQVTGGDGDDTIIWRNGDGSDVVTGGAGTDTQQLIMSDAAGDAATLTNFLGFGLFQRTNLVPFTLSMSTIERVDFQGQGGDDTFAIGNLAGTTITEVLFSGGDGVDTLDTSLAAVKVTANGGAGNDGLIGGGGNDTIAGDTGTDTIIAGGGDDLIIWRNGDGTDTVDGGAGVDTQQLIMSNTEGDVATLTAAGANAVFARTNLVAFQVTMANVERVDFQGLGGDDSFTIGDLTGTPITQVLFSGGAGNDTLAGLAGGVATATPITGSGGDGNDTLTGGTAADTLNGDAGNDTLEGHRGNDIINAGDGDDTIIWRNGDGTDTVDGGAGTDTQQLLMSDTDGDVATLTAAGANAVFARTNLVPFQVTMANVERIDFQGQGGGDTFTVGSLAGTPVTAILFSGGDGNDTLDASAAAVGVTASGGAGNDLLTGGTANDTLNGGPGTDTLNGGGGFDFADYSTSPSGVTASLASPASNTGEALGDVYNSIEGLRGSAFSDFLIGDANGNTLVGGAGLDRLFGGGGNDSIVDDDGASSEMNGEAGSDTIFGGTGNDYITGGDGDDVVVGGTDGQDSLYGGGGNDYIVAADTDNNGVGSVLDGGAGANQLYALVGSGKDYAVGGEGADIIATGAGSDFIFGNDGNDTIVAGAGTDYIYGNAGNDFIYTDDLVTPSQDFVYVSGLSGFGTGIDTVADFTPGANGDVAVIVGTSGLTSFAQVQAAATDIGVYTVIDLSGGNQLFLYNVDPGQLTADNFLFL